VLMVDGKEPGASRQGQWLPTDEPITLYQPKETGDGGSGMLPHSLVQRFKKTLDKLDTALDSVNKVIGDEANRQNIKAALAEFRAASAKMKDLAQSGESAFKTYDKLGGRLLEEIDKFGKVMATFEHKLAPKLVDDADRFGELLTALTNTARKLNSDKGTAGKLLNDPKLYNELIDTFATLRKMLEKWDTEGVNLKMSR